MSIIAGNTILASDFISTSAGAGDSGRVPKLNASGKIDPSFLNLPFIAQDIGIDNQNRTYRELQTASSNDGSVLFIAIYSTGDSNLRLMRYAKDALGHYYQTHAITPINVNLNSNTLGLSIVGSFVYMNYRSATPTNFLTRYAIADLTGSTAMSFSGTAGYGPSFSDGTFLYIQNPSSTPDFYKFSISGTTATNSATITYTSATPQWTMCNGTNVFMVTTSPGTTITVVKYALAGGAAVTTTTIGNNFYLYNQTGAALFFGNTYTMGMASIFNASNPTQITGSAVHLQAITLP